MNGTGVAGIIGGDSGWGVYGFATSPTASSIGVEGQSAGSNGAGVKGYASSTSGFTSGAIGQADSTSGTGVYGTAIATSGTTYGVQGWNSSTSGTGVYGTATAASGSTVGVEGDTASPAGIGVKGVNSATSGLAYGVYGTTASADDNATGVYGHATAASGNTNGVWGQVDSDGGWGVYGSATSTTGKPVAVGGNAPSNGWALYGGGNAAVTGDLHVTGTLSKGGGSFKIDHPLDPANKFLYHSFVESPDMKNVYDGVVTLDAAGEATVSLPDWIEALNRDFRYQLTAIGSSAPDLYVKSEVKANAFSIGGGKAGQRISWLLTGIRKDAWADAHRIPVEEDKPADERGLYLHPTENGQPAAKGIDAVRNAAMKPQHK